MYNRKLPILFLLVCGVTLNNLASGLSVRSESEAENFTGWGSNAEQEDAFTGWGSNAAQEDAFTGWGSKTDQEDAFTGWGLNAVQEDAFTGWGSNAEQEDAFTGWGSNAEQEDAFTGWGSIAEQEDAFTGWGSNSEDVESAEGPSTSLLKVALTEHNKFRRRHGVPDLKPDQKLNAIAQKYANYLASNNLFQHSKTDYENLAGAPGKTKEDAIRYAVKKWYDEEKIYRKVYKYKNGAFSLKTGHFTAMIWRKTTNLGIGVAYNKAKKWWVVVANYSPRGNTKGEFEGNVPPPKG